MSLIEQGLWASARDDYEKAVGISAATLDKIGIHEPAAVQAGAATVLIHMKHLRDQHNRTEREMSQVPAALKQDDRKEFAVPRTLPPCPKCGGEMKDNENRKTDKSPHFVCLQAKGQCGKAGDRGGFFPTGAWQK